MANGPLGDVFNPPGLPITPQGESPEAQLRRNVAGARQQAQQTLGGIADPVARGQAANTLLGQLAVPRAQPVQSPAQTPQQQGTQQFSEAFNTLQRQLQLQDERLNPEGQAQIGGSLAGLQSSAAALNNPELMQLLAPILGFQGQLGISSAAPLLQAVTGARPGINTLLGA